MPALVLYLLKVNIALVLFYLAYRFALRRLTFYTLNRFFLVGGIIFSSVYPFVDLSDLFKKHEVLNEQVIVLIPDWNTVQHVSEKVYSFDYWQLLIVLFWTGVFIMTIRLSVQLISLYRIHRCSKPETINEYQFRKINGKVNPFSFWQNIYLNPDQHQQEELKAILKHEQIHVKEWHTLDILLAEISTVFYWFNPGVWLMKQAVRENLEFITDRRVLKSGIDSKTYQYSLVRISTLPRSYSLVNNFNFLSIKKRIMMMNTKQSSKANISRYMLLLPLVVVLSLAFTVSKARKENKTLQQIAKSGLATIVERVSGNTSETGIQGESASVIEQPLILNDLPKHPETIADILRALNIDTLKKQTNIAISRYPILSSETARTLAIAFLQGGNQVKQDTVKKTYYVRLVDLQDTTKKVVKTYTYSTPNSALAEKLQNKMAGLNIRVTGGQQDTTKKVSSTNSIDIRGFGTPLFVIDGVVRGNDATATAAFQKLNPEDIVDVTIIKDASAAAYGLQGVNGVILVTTTKGNKDGKPVFTITKSADNEAVKEKLGIVNNEVLEIIKKSNNLVIIDGKEAIKEEIERLSIVDIENVNFLMNEAAIKKYGEKGKNGAIIVTKKAGR